MRWIYFQQKFNNRVKYTTSEIDFSVTMKYDKFLKFIQQNYKLKNFVDMQNALDSFKSILALENGEWKVDEVPVNLTQDILQLYEYNKSKLENNKSIFNKDIFSRFKK